MQKKVLTEQALYFGDVAMPKDWDIDRDKLSGDILQSVIKNKNFPFSRTWDILNTYIRDHIGLKYDISLVNKDTWGNIYKPSETTIPLLNIDPVDLRNSPDFTLLYGVNLINKETWGNIYKPSETTIPLLNIDPVDLRNSPDFTLLYGVKVDKCWVRIHYEDNRRKGRSWDIPLTNNQFIMFPSTNMYYLTNNQKDSLNFVQTITYEYI